MTFTPEQTEALKAPLVITHVKQREQAGRKLSYLESWWAISEANRIFGFDGWTRETVDLIPLGEPRLVGDKYRVGYRAKVRITVGDAITREGCGFGSGIDKDPDQAHESALKEAESDAMKRALMTFGNPFGLALYDKTQANVVAEPRAANVGGKAIPGVMTGTDLANQGRKSSAQAKRDGDHERYTGEIDKLDEAGIIDWLSHFDEYTSTAPLSWLDPLKNRLQLRHEELSGADSIQGEADAMDEAFRASVGPGRASGMAGDNGQRAA